MPKTSDLLLILKPEEKEAAQKFIERRLRTLDAAQLTQLQILSNAARQQIRRLQAGKERYRAVPNRAGQVMVKLYDSALSGLIRLVAECSRTTAAKQREQREKQQVRAAQQEDPEGIDAKGEGPDEETADFLLPCSAEEEAHALDFIREKAKKIDVSDLGRFRDAYQELVTWWESEKGQTDGLLVGQYGDVTSSKGRLSIRQKRESFRIEIFNPLKSLFQEIHSHYQAESKKVAEEGR